MLWRLVVFLSLLGGEVLAAPFPGKYSLPTLPFGRRIQYYILKKDGSYKEGYDTGQGQYQSAVASDANEVDGQFGFKNPEGEDISVRYKSGIGGFVPEAYGVVIPKTVIPVDQGEFVDPLANPNADGTYAFSYSANDHGRSETSDSEGNILGQYHFYGADGQRYRYRYKAGAGQGFVVDIDLEPGAPRREAKEVSLPDQPTVNALPVPELPSPPVQNLPQKPAQEEEFVDPLADPNVDGTYSFSYQADDHGRQESSDSEGNILGEYHFYTEDGGHYKLTYNAGADTGFVVDIDAKEGEGAPEREPKQVYLPASPESSPPKSSVQKPPQLIPVTFVQPTVPVAPAQEQEFVDPLADPNADGTYSFSYKADDHGRQESSDSEGNILGEYHFYTEDGGHYKLRYNAGAEKGFVVDIDQTAGVPPAPESKEPSSVEFPPFDPSSKPAVPANILPGVRSSAVPKVKSEPSQPNEGDSNIPSSYSFSYNTGEQEHTQTSDSSGKVSGNFAFVADDGVRRRVDYTASAESGFEASGEHLPKVQQEEIANVQNFEPQRQNVPVAPKSPTKSALPIPQTPTLSEGSDSDNTDKSYSFSYHAGDSARTEISDKEGTITGFFTFLDENKQQRTVIYNAGELIGFLADGEHLPVRADIPLPKFAIPALYPVNRETPNPKTAAEVSDVQASVNPDGSYTFSFVTSDQSRTETGTADGKVTGSFTFVANEGQRFSTNYEAGAETGFVPEGQHIPIPPAVPQTADTTSVDGSPKSSFESEKPSVPVVSIKQPVLEEPQRTPVSQPALNIQEKPQVRPAVLVVKSPVFAVSTPKDAGAKFGEKIRLPEGVLHQWLPGTSPKEYGYIYKDE